jgi:hypothetical protein
VYNAAFLSRVLRYSFLDPLPALDAFSGIGGIALALEGLSFPVMYCEIDPVCLAVLARRIECGDLPRAPFDTDVRALTGQRLLALPQPPRMLTFGSPCQDLSSVGKRRGLQHGPRSSLFYEAMRICRECPSIEWIFWENVQGALQKEMPQVLGEMAASGYADLRYMVLSAAEVGAPQLRQRIFVLGHREATGCVPRDRDGMAGQALRAASLHDSEALLEHRGAAPDEAHDERHRVPGAVRRQHPRPPDPVVWSGEPVPRVALKQVLSQRRVGGVADGLPGGVDAVVARRVALQSTANHRRNETLGNSVVPLCVRTAFLLLTGVLDDDDEDEAGEGRCHPSSGLDGSTQCSSGDVAGGQTRASSKDETEDGGCGGPGAHDESDAHEAGGQHDIAERETCCGDAGA